MADRRGRKGSSDALIPKNRRAWALEIWADRIEIAKLPSGAWLLREAAKELQFDEEVVDELLSRLLTYKREAASTAALTESRRWRKMRL